MEIRSRIRRSTSTTGRGMGGHPDYSFVSNHRFEPPGPLMVVYRDSRYRRRHRTQAYPSWVLPPRRNWYCGQENFHQTRVCRKGCGRMGRRNCFVGHHLDNVADGCWMTFKVLRCVIEDILQSVCIIRVEINTRDWRGAPRVLNHCWRIDRSQKTAFA